MRGGGGGGGVSGSQMVLGKLSVPRHPTNLDNSRARAQGPIALAVGAGGFFFFFFGHFFL